MTIQLQGVRHFLFLLIVSSALYATSLHAHAQTPLSTSSTSTSTTPTKVNVAPSAELSYLLKTVQAGFPITGHAKINWQIIDKNNVQNYRVDTETTVSIFGQIHATQSMGNINELGLAPTKFTEKRLRKTATTTRFNYANKTITFSETNDTLPMVGTEQDRTSAIWQLVALARTTGENVNIGQQWKMRVSSNKDVDPWAFILEEKVTINTALGKLSCLHIVRTPPPDAKDQRLDIWLATELQYYPVQIKFLEGDGSHIDQIIVAIKSK